MGNNAERISVFSFFIRVVIVLILVTAVWWKLSGIISQPGAYLAGYIFENQFLWVQNITVTPQKMTVDTSIKVLVAVKDPETNVTRNTVAFLISEVDPRKYSYSLPLLLALLIVGENRKRIGRLISGTVLLIPFHAFSIVMALLKDFAIDGGQNAMVQMGFSQFQLELVAFGYQLGTLMVPTLIPVLLWLWLDKQTVMHLLPVAVRSYLCTPAEKSVS